MEVEFFSSKVLCHKRQKSFGSEKLYFFGVSLKMLWKNDQEQRQKAEKNIKRQGQLCSFFNRYFDDRVFKQGNLTQRRNIFVKATNTLEAENNHVKLRTEKNRFVVSIKKSVTESSGLQYLSASIEGDDRLLQ